MPMGQSRRKRPPPIQSRIILSLKGRSSLQPRSRLCLDTRSTPQQQVQAASSPAPPCGLDRRTSSPTLSGRSSLLLMSSTWLRTQLSPLLSSPSRHHLGRGHLKCHLQSDATCRNRHHPARPCRRCRRSLAARRRASRPPPRVPRRPESSPARCCRRSALRCCAQRGHCRGGGGGGGGLSRRHARSGRTSLC